MPGRPLFSQVLLWQKGQKTAMITIKWTLKKQTL